MTGTTKRLAALGAAAALVVAACATGTADEAAIAMRDSVAATATEFGLADHVDEIVVTFTEVPCTRAGGTAALAVLDVAIPLEEFDATAVERVGGFWAGYHGRDFVRTAAIPGAPSVIGVEGILREGEVLGFVYSTADESLDLQGLSACLPRRAIDD